MSVHFSNPKIRLGHIPALGIVQPYASLIAWDEKRFLAKKWRTDYRGRIAIFAASKWESPGHYRCLDSPFREVIQEHLCLPDLVPDYFRIISERLPFSAFVATARIAECISASDHRIPEMAARYAARYESSFGDYGGPVFAWLLEDVIPLPAPIRSRGSRNWFHVPVATLYPPEGQEHAIRPDTIPPELA